MNRWIKTESLSEKIKYENNENPTHSNKIRENIDMFIPTIRNN